VTYKIENEGEDFRDEKSAMDGHGGCICGSIGFEAVGNGEPGLSGPWGEVLGPVVFDQRGVAEGWATAAHGLNSVHSRSTGEGGEQEDTCRGRSVFRRFGRGDMGPSEAKRCHASRVVVVVHTL
jgi:hypothetical protein